jgi:hypothetical protein
MHSLYTSGEIMPFNIELSCPDIAIKIQVVKSVITVYFNGPDDIASPKRTQWRMLVQAIIPSLPEFEPADRIDKDISINIYHQKKDHTTTQERSVLHLHMHHRVEVTPDMLSLYLKSIYAQQERRGEEYHFFSGPEEVDSIIETFASYYRDYKGSSIERVYEEETTLTDPEIEEHIEEIIKLTKRKAAIEHQTTAALRALSLFSSMTPSQPHDLSNSALMSNSEPLA